MKKIIGWIFNSLLIIWTFFKWILDWIGRGTLIADAPQWVTQLVDEGTKLLPATTPWVPGILATLITLYLIDWLPKFGVKSGAEQKPTLESAEYIPMGEAATVLYEQARTAGSIWAYAAERLGAPGFNGESSADEILNYMATYIADKIQLYGIRSPSRVLEEISTTKTTGEFTNECSCYRLWNSNSDTYADIKIKKKDLDDLVEEIKNGLSTKDKI